jgi:hypothetical protein
MFYDYRSKATLDDDTESESESVMLTRAHTKQKEALKSNEYSVENGNLKSATKERNIKSPTHSETRVDQSASSQTSTTRKPPPPQRKSTQRTETTPQKGIGSRTSPSRTPPPPQRKSPRRTETTPQKGIGNEIEKSTRPSEPKRNQSGGPSASKSQTRTPSPGKCIGKKLDDNKTSRKEMGTELNKSRDKRPGIRIVKNKSGQNKRQKPDQGKESQVKTSEEPKTSEESQISDKDRPTIPTTPPKRVSTQNPIHACPSQCGFGLCHRCWSLMLVGNDTGSDTQKQGRRRGRHNGEIACPEIHEQMYMLNEMSDQAYFYKSYVDKKTKTDTYKFPRTCDFCKSSLTIDAK